MERTEIDSLQQTITRLESELKSYRSWGWSEDNLPPSVADWRKTTDEANKLLQDKQRLESELAEAKRLLSGAYHDALGKSYVETEMDRSQAIQERDTLREKLAVFDDPNAPKTWNDMIDELLKLRQQLAAATARAERLSAALVKAKEYIRTTHHAGAWWNHRPAFDAIGDNGWLTAALAEEKA